MTHARCVRLLVIPVFVLAYATCASPSPPSPAPEPVRDLPILEHQAECSPLEARQPILRIRWPIPPRPADVFIDVSLYKDGFTTGRFVSAPAGDPRAVPSSGVVLRAHEVQAQAAQAAQPASALAVRLVSLRPVNDGKQIEAVLGGLNPGVNYYIRVRGVPGQTIRVQAPICPVDYVETPRESPK